MKLYMVKEGTNYLQEAILDDVAGLDGIWSDYRIDAFEFTQLDAAKRIKKALGPVTRVVGVKAKP